MPRQKDTAADSKFKGAQKSAQEVAVVTEHDPVCQIDNPLVQDVWDKLAPPLIRAKIVNFATEEAFTDLCFHIVVLRKMRHDVLNEDTAWFELVQSYGDGGTPITSLKEAGKLKAYRQWRKSYNDLLKDLSLRPKDMAGLWNLNQNTEDDEDLFT